MTHERSHLLSGEERAVVRRGQILRLLAVPFILGLLQTVATAAEVDALRSLACTAFFAGHQYHADELDSTSCRAPAVEAHFSDLMFRVTVSVTFANLVGMLVYGRLFSLGARRWMAVLGMVGNLVARIPMVILPLSRYPFLLPQSLRAWSPSTMVHIYWACLVICGLSGASELVILCMDSYIVDAASPHVRSQLFARLQIAQLLGASVGPTLGQFAVTALPAVANRYFGYAHPVGRDYSEFLFNTASYWLAISIAAFGICWVVFGVQALPKSNTYECKCGKKSLVAPDWLGQYRLLLPRRVSGWHYDSRIAQFTMSESLNGLSVEGVVVLVYVLGYVFHWGQAQLSLALSVSNSLNLIMTVFCLPVAVKEILRRQQRPRLMQDMPDDTVRKCIDACECDDTVSDRQRTEVRMWRARADLNAGRFSLLSNVISWLLLAMGVWLENTGIVIIGACALSLGVCAAPMIRSAACTYADIISKKQAPLPLPPGAKGVAPHRGADSYLVIVSTILLPVLLTGPVLRNLVYSATIATFPGAFFIVIAGIQFTSWLFLAPI